MSAASLAGVILAANPATFLRLADALVEQAALADLNHWRVEWNALAPLTSLDDMPHADEWRGGARAALEAAAPLIAAQALRDAADGYQTGGWADDLPAGGSRPALILGMSRRAVAWLRARADEIEAGR